MNSETIGLVVFLSVVAQLVLLILWVISKPIMDLDDVESRQLEGELPEVKFKLTPEQRAMFDKRFREGMKGVLKYHNNSKRDW